MADTQTVVTSGFGKINLRDLGQGAIMAGLGAAAGFLYPFLDAWVLGKPAVIDLSIVWKAAAGAAILHLIRKLTGKETVVITNPTPQQVEAVKTGEGEAKVVVKPATENPVLDRNKNL